MTTISRTTVPLPPSTAKGGVPVNIADRLTIKPMQLTAAQEAELAQRSAKAAEVESASQKLSEQAKRLASNESHEMYMPNVSDLSFENAQKSLGIAQVMIRNKEDVGVNVHGRYGDQEISDLNSYVAALKDYISKYDEAAQPSNPAAQANGIAASAYSQMQVMGEKVGDDV